MMSSSLINLCLDSIANNFAKYNLLFRNENDFYTKRKLEFLQRIYSSDLLSQLYIKDNLTDEFMDILVNKYVKFLNTSWFKKCSWDKVTSKMAEIGCHLEKIVFNHNYCDGRGEVTPWQYIICHLTNLKSFTFHFKCDDLILKSVAEFCHNIEEIDIRDSNVTFEGVKYLCKNENGKVVHITLKKLCFGERTLIDADHLGFLLKNLPSLEVIEHPHLPFALHSLHINVLTAIDKVEPYKITELHLRSIDRQHPSFPDVLKVCASVCPHLKYLSCCVLLEEELNHLFNLHDLKQLNIEFISDSKININSLLMSTGGKLTSLTISNCTVSISVLAGSCHCLTELTLNTVNILGNKDSKPLFNALSSLTLIENSEEASSMKGITLMLLSSFFKLESLSFESCTLTCSEVQEAVLKCCKLYPVKKIIFCMSRIENKFIKDLLCSNRTLRYLGIYATSKIQDSLDLFRFAKTLPNKPKIAIDVFKDTDDSGSEESIYDPYSDSDID